MPTDIFASTAGFAGLIVIQQAWFLERQWQLAARIERSTVCGLRMHRLLA
jgi:hypothetical protein